MRLHNSLLASSSSSHHKNAHALYLANAVNCRKRPAGHHAHHCQTRCSYTHSQPTQQQGDDQPQLQHPPFLPCPPPLPPSDAPTLGGLTHREELMRLLGLLPPEVQQEILQHPELDQLVEVVMDLGRRPMARLPSGDVWLAQEPVTEDQIRYAVSQVGEFGGDNRAGIDRTLHRISCIRNRDGRIIGLTCRVGRAIPGTASIVADLIQKGKSILLLGRPGVGKTTAIRDVCRMLSDSYHKRVVVVDTSNEIGGDGDIPHPGIGGARRMQVPQPEAQHRVMIEAVENHMPEVIIIDEIGTSAETMAARTISQRGVQLVATAHGNQLENLIKNPALCDLVGGICSVTLGDDEARRRGGQKSVLERESPPTFDAAVEIIHRERWNIHTDVASAVDTILAGGVPLGELRERSESGEIAVHRGRSAEGRAASAPASQDPLRRSIGLANFPFGSDSLLAAQLMDSGPAAYRRDTAQDDFDLPENLEDAMFVLYCHGIEEYKVRTSLKMLQLRGAVMLTDRVAGCDAVLALRSKIKSGGWIRMAAKAAGVPVYTVKSASQSNLSRALRTLLGLEPSAGGQFMRSGDDGDDLDLAGEHTATEFDQEEDVGIGSRRAVESGAGAGAAQGAASRKALMSRTDALEEARVAVEQIVLSQQQAIELMPRVAAVIESQVELVRSYSLDYEIVGSEMNLRLRILPRAKSPA